MSCVKCGKKTEGTNVFCPECLAGMDAYPVKPGTLAHIPPRPEPAARKTPRHAKEKSPEEQIAFLHKLVQFLAVCIAGLATTLLVGLGVLFFVLSEDAAQEPPSPQTPMGRNYTTSAPAADE